MYNLLSDLKYVRTYVYISTYSVAKVDYRGAAAPEN